MYLYCYVYIFLLFCMFCSVYSVFIVPTGTLRLPGLRFFHAFFSALRQMPGYNLQRRGTVHTLPKLIVFLYVLFMCKCVLYYYRHQVSNQLQLTNISLSLNFICLFFKTPASYRILCCSCIDNSDTNHKALLKWKPKEY